MHTQLVRRHNQQQSKQTDPLTHHIQNRCDAIAKAMHEVPPHAESSGADSSGLILGVSEIEKGLVGGEGGGGKREEDTRSSSRCSGVSSRRRRFVLLSTSMFDPKLSISVALKN